MVTSLDGITLTPNFTCPDILVPPPHNVKGKALGFPRKGKQQLSSWEQCGKCCILRAHVERDEEKQSALLKAEFILN